MDTGEQSILDEAKSVVYGARQDAYGHPKEDFARTAKLWTEILHTAVSARDVALCMIALKLSREVNKHTRDNLVDIAGYAATIERLDEQSDPSEQPGEIHSSWIKPDGGLVKLCRVPETFAHQLEEVLLDVENACRA